MAAFLILQNNSNPNAAWSKVARGIEASGHICHVPGMPNCSDSDLTSHIDFAFEEILRSGWDKITLVGHGYGGMVVTGVASLCPAQINNIVYLDAAVPLPGQSYFDLFKAASADPLEIPEQTPIPPYLEKIHYNPVPLLSLPKDYIQCSQSILLPMTCVSQQNLSLEGLGGQWRCHQLNAPHEAMVALPTLVTALLLKSLQP